MIDTKNKCIKECKDDAIFLFNNEYNGKWLQICSKGFYTDGDKNICYCQENDVSKDCPAENNVNNLCSTCKTGYYPKKEEVSSPLKNCYNSGSKPTKYIFNSAGYYEACYESCAACTEIGTSTANKCLTCKTGYNSEAVAGSYNCKQKCTHYYFIENGEIKCTESAQCPENYKLVNSSIECITDCKSKNLYEYNNAYYSFFPNDHYTKDTIETCKCMTNIACLECPLTHEENHLCISFYMLENEI